MAFSKQITYNTAGNIVSLFCQWLIMMIIPKITNFSEAGMFALALSVCSILNIFATFSLNQYQISDQYVRYDENEYRVSRILTISLSFAMCLAFVLLFDYSIEQKLVIIAYMLYRNILHFAYLYTATLQVKERLDYVGKCTIAEGIASLVSFVAAYNYTHNLVISVIIMAAIGGGLFLVTVMHGYKKIAGGSLSVHHAEPLQVKNLMKLGIPLLLSTVAPIVITALPKIILQATAGDEILGIFSTLSAPTIVIPTLITGIFAPFIVYFSNLSRSGDLALLRKQYTRMTMLVLGFGILCYTMSRLFGGFAFEMLYGEDIVPYVRYFDILIVGIILYSIGMCGITVLITKEQGRPAAISSLLSLAVSAAIFILIIPEYGIDGASYGLVAAYGIFCFAVSLCVYMLPLTGVVKMKSPS